VEEGWEGSVKDPFIRLDFGRTEGFFLEDHENSVQKLDVFCEVIKLGISIRVALFDSWNTHIVKKN